MPTVFNADEVLEMALEIERNGATFYRRAAEQAEAPEVAALLRELGEMEEEHEELFDSLRDRLPAEATPEVVYDPNGDVAHYLRAAADTHVFQVGRDDPSRLSDASLQEVLEAAIGFEKDTVVFFLGVREMVPDELGRDELDRLIREEMDHISSLTRQLQAAQGASSD